MTTRYNQCVLSGITLLHYRNYINKTFKFPNKLTLILGKNGQGKTNLLEAIAFFSTGQNIRGATIDDCIQLDQEYAQIQAVVNKQDETFKLDLLLNHGQVQGRRTNKLIFSLNEVRKQRKAMIGLLPTVAFLPEDLRIITGSPARRRQFLDELLLQIDAEYSHHLERYTQTLKRRNKVLEQIRDLGVSPTALTFWTQAILKHGQAIQEARTTLINQLNAVEFPVELTIEYLPSIMSEERLEKYAQAEIATGHTLIGPQKDDFQIKFQILNSKFQTSQLANQSTSQPIHSHGSRGQQRLGVLWIKIGAFQLLTTHYNAPPILLLDDIFSELDQGHRQMVLDLVDTTQTIITSAEENIVNDFPVLQKADIIRL